MRKTLWALKACFETGFSVLMFAHSEPVFGFLWTVVAILDLYTVYRTKEN